MRINPTSDNNHDHKDYHGNAPELPPRPMSGRGGDRLSSSSNFDLNPGALHYIAY